MVDHPMGSRGRSRGADAAVRAAAGRAGWIGPRGDGAVASAPRSLRVSSAATILRSRMQVHELTTVRQEGVRGPRALKRAPTRLDFRGASPPLSCELFRSAGIVPTPMTGGSAAVTPVDLDPVDLSRRLPARG
jgi:hypothetical protein